MTVQRKIFYGVTSAIVLLLLCLPSTNWLLRLQLLPISPGGQVGMSYLADLDSDPIAKEVALRAVVAKNPEDFALQYATAVQSAKSKEAIQKLEPLLEKFPNEPAVPATILRLMCSDFPKGHRPEEDLLSPPRKETKSEEEKETLPNLANLARFDALAAKWEQRETDNAYFPAMRAVGYFAVHKDAEAVAAWKRAAEKPKWNDYVLYEMAVRGNLLQKLNGGSEVGFLLRATTWSGILFPHYSKLRAAARMASYKAVEAELAGKTEDGFALRRATRLNGERIAVQGQTAITNLVGAAITAISQSRPGGAPALKSESDNAEAKKALIQKKRAVYVAYLRKTNHPEEAVAFQSATEKGEQIKAISRAGMDQSYFGFSNKVFRLFGFWIGDLLLMIGMLVSLAFSIVFHLVYRFSPGLQNEEHLQPSARWGVTSAITLSSVILLTSWLAVKNPEVPSWIGLGVCGIVLLGAIIFPFLQQLNRQEVGHGLLIGLATLIAVALIVGAMAISSQLFQGIFYFLNSIGLGEAVDESSQDFWKNTFPTIVSGAIILLPVFILSLASLFSVIVGVPIASGVTRGIRAVSLPIAFLFLYAYMLCFLATLRYENNAVAETKRVQTIGELQAYAEITGKPMPTMK